MNVDTGVNAILSANAALIASVPASRIRMPGDYQDVTRPWIVHFPAGGVDPTYTHDGLESLRFWERYQVSIFADSYAGGRPLVETVVDALTGNHEGITAFWSPGGFRYTHTTQPPGHQFVLEFSISEGLSTMPEIVFGSTSKPTASAVYRGVFWVTRGGAGENDLIEVCIKNDSDTYEWVALF